MKLLSIRTSPYRGSPERVIDLCTQNGEPHLLVALTGPPGVGKTSLLELVARHKEHVAPYGRPTSSRDMLGPEGTRLEVATSWQLEAHEQKSTGHDGTPVTALSVWHPKRNEARADPALVHVLARYRHGAEWGKVDFVPTDRITPSGPGSPGEPTFWQKTRRLSLGNDKYAGLSRLYASADRKQRQTLGELLAELRPGLVAALDDGKLCFETPAGRRAPTQLSLTHRLAFQLAATFVLVGLHHSVVLIDTPELGLPAGEALSTLRALRDFAPTTQLITTTTDTEILTASETRVIRLEPT